MKATRIADTADLVISQVSDCTVLRHRTPSERLPRVILWGISGGVVLGLVAFVNVAVFFALEALWLFLMVAWATYKPAGCSRLEIRFRDGTLSQNGFSAGGVSTFWQNEYCRADVFSGQYGFVTTEGEFKVLFESDARPIHGFTLWQEYAAICGCAFLSRNEDPLKRLSD